MDDAAVVLEECPGCGVAYEIPASEISAAGRRVRCVRCAETWIVQSAAAIPSDPEITHTRADGAHGIPERRGSPAGFWLGWLAAVIIAGAVGGYVFREPLAREFPEIGVVLERYAAWLSAFF